MMDRVTHVKLGPRYNLTTTAMVTSNSLFPSLLQEQKNAYSAFGLAKGLCLVLPKAPLTYYIW